jgi:hypothetical protein
MRACGCRAAANTDAIAYLAELEAHATVLGIDAAVAFAPPTDAIADAYAASDLVLQVSRKPEAFGRTVLEALSVGRPVVGWDHGGVGELLRAWQTRGAVPPFDGDALLAGGPRRAGASADASGYDAAHLARHAGRNTRGLCRTCRRPLITRSRHAGGWRWAPAWVLVFVALWPAPGYAEGVMVLGALAAIVRLLVSRFRGGSALLTGPAWALTSVLFFAYWLPEAFSAIDAVDRAVALREAAFDLRYLPFLWLVAAAVADARGRRITFGGLGIIVGIWTVDGVLQAVFGTSPLFFGIDTIKHRDQRTRHVHAMQNRWQWIA